MVLVRVDHERVHWHVLPECFQQRFGVGLDGRVEDEDGRGGFECRDGLAQFGEAVRAVSVRDLGRSDVQGAFTHRVLLVVSLGIR